MNLLECMKKIIGGFNKDDYFDSHTIIEELIRNKEYHLAYLQEYQQNCTVAQYHGQIAQKLNEINGIKKIGKAKSHTIYGNISENMLWQKIT